MQCAVWCGRRTSVFVMVSPHGQSALQDRWLSRLQDKLPSCLWYQRTVRCHADVMRACADLSIPPLLSTFLSAAARGRRNIRGSTCVPGYWCGHCHRHCTAQREPPALLVYCTEAPATLLPHVPALLGAACIFSPIHRPAAVQLQLCCL